MSRSPLSLAKMTYDGAQSRGAMEIKGKGEMRTFLLADAEGIAGG